MFEVKTDIEKGSEVTLHLRGRLDTTTAPELEDGIKKLPDGITRYTFDLKELEYISSAGLRVLLMTQKMMTDRNRTRVKILNVSKDIMEIFEVTGFDDILDIVKAED